MNYITLDYVNNIIDNESKDIYLRMLRLKATTQHPINKELMTFNTNSDKKIGFVLLNNVIEIPLLNHDFLAKGKILSIKFTTFNINDMEKEVTNIIHQMDSNTTSIKNKELILTTFEYLKQLFK